MRLPTIDLEIHDLSALKDVPVFSVYGARYFLSRPAPKPKWLIPGLIPLGVPSVLAAKGGLGKSFLALQMCIALAAGKAFLDFEALDPMAMVYFGLEDSLDTFHGRFESIVDHYKFCLDWTEQDQANLDANFAAPFINWKSSAATSYLPDLTPALEMILATNEANGIKPGGIIIDTLARVSDGDENTVQALRPVLNACMKLAEFGFTPVVLHHVSKGQDGAKSKDKILISDRMNTEWVRGSSAIVDNFRCVLQFAALSELEAQTAGLDPDRARMGQYLVFGCTKLNGGQKAPWRLLEQDEAGRWSSRQDGAEILAKLRGAGAVADMNKQNALLLDLHAASKTGNEPDRVELAAKHCGDTKDPQASLRTMLRKLRSAGLVHRTEMALTIQGRERVQSLQGGHA